MTSGTMTWTYMSNNLNVQQLYMYNLIVFVSWFLYVHRDLVRLKMCHVEVTHTHTHTHTHDFVRSLHVAAFLWAWQICRVRKGELAGPTDWWVDQTHALVYAHIYQYVEVWNILFLNWCMYSWFRFRFIEVDLKGCLDMLMLCAWCLSLCTLKHNYIT